MQFITPFLLGYPLYPSKNSITYMVMRKSLQEEKKTRCYVKVIHVVAVLGWVGRIKCQ